MMFVLDIKMLKAFVQLPKKSKKGKLRTGLCTKVSKIKISNKNLHSEFNRFATNGTTLTFSGAKKTQIHMGARQKGTTNLSLRTYNTRFFYVF